MPIRVKLNPSLVGKVRSKLKGNSSDLLSLIEQALTEQGSLEKVHEAVQNGTNYSKTTNIESVHAANTSIVDMDNTLYLLTDKLMEVTELIPFEALTKDTYKIRDSNWE